MTTTAPNEATLRRARADLARLEAEHTAAETARRDRIRAAGRTLASDRWQHINDSPASQQRDDADRAWAAVIANPDATLDDLFRAWTGRRIAAAVKYTEARHFAAGADQWLGYEVNHIGVQIGRPKPTEDSSLGWTFDAAVTEWISARTTAAARTATAQWQAEEDTVLTAAETDPQ